MTRTELIERLYIRVMDPELEPRTRRAINRVLDHADLMAGEDFAESRREVVARKCRALRRVVVDVMRWEVEADADMAAFGAPGECWGLVRRQSARALRRAVEQLGLKAADIADAFTGFIRIEREYVPEGDAPPAYDEWAFLTSYGLEVEPVEVLRARRLAHRRYTLRP